MVAVDSQTAAQLFLTLLQARGLPHQYGSLLRLPWCNSLYKLHTGWAESSTPLEIAAMWADTYTEWWWREMCNCYQQRSGESLDGTGCLGRWRPGHMPVKEEWQWLSHPTATPSLYCANFRSIWRSGPKVFAIFNQTNIRLKVLIWKIIILKAKEWLIWNSGQWSLLKGWDRDEIMKDHTGSYNNIGDFLILYLEVGSQVLVLLSCFTM